MEKKLKELLLVLIKKMDNNKNITLVKPYSTSVTFWYSGSQYEMFYDENYNIDLLKEGHFIKCFGSPIEVDIYLEIYLERIEYCETCKIVEPIHNDDFVLCPICGANLT